MTHVDRNWETWGTELQMRRRRKMFPQVSTLGWLLEYPSSGEAAEVAWSEGSNAEARGDLVLALDRAHSWLRTFAHTHARGRLACALDRSICVSPTLNLQLMSSEAYLRDLLTAAVGGRRQPGQ